MDAVIVILLFVSSHSSISSFESANTVSRFDARGTHSNKTVLVSSGARFSAISPMSSISPFTESATSNDPPVAIVPTFLTVAVAVSRAPRVIGCCMTISVTIRSGMAYQTVVRQLLSSQISSISFSGSAQIVISSRFSDIVKVPIVLAYRSLSFRAGTG